MRSSIPRPKTYFGKTRTPISKPTEKSHGFGIKQKISEEKTNKRDSNNIRLRPPWHPQELAVEWSRVRRCFAKIYKRLGNRVLDLQTRSVFRISEKKSAYSQECRDFRHFLPIFGPNNLLPLTDTGT